MQGSISSKELNCALSLDAGVKEKIAKYEKANWAANLSSPSVKLTWRKFLSKLEKAVSSEKLNDNLLIELIHYLSTKDSVDLIEQIGKLNQDRQVRFLELLNWVSTNGANAEQRENAGQVRERILMLYRMKEYPKIYSQARITRAMHIIKSQPLEKEVK